MLERRLIQIKEKYIGCTNKTCSNRSFIVIHLDLKANSILRCTLCKKEYQIHKLESNAIDVKKDETRIVFVL